MAGSFESDCRLRWVRRHHEEPLEVLLAACGEGDRAEECRFDAVEAKGTTDLLGDLGRCDAHLGATARFCREHAAIRWLADPRDLEAVVASEAWAEDLGRALGHLHACGEGPGCEALPTPKQPGCRQLVEEVAADPTICTR